MDKECEVVNLSRFKNQDQLEQQVRYSRQDLKLFKASIYYFYKLRNDNKIGDDTLRSLIKYSCALFVESQIENVFRKVVEKHISKLWELEILSIEDDLKDLYSYEESSKIIDSLRKAYI